MCSISIENLPMFSTLLSLTNVPMACLFFISLLANIQLHFKPSLRIVVLVKDF